MGARPISASQKPSIDQKSPIMSDIPPQKDRIGFNNDQCIISTHSGAMPPVPEGGIPSSPSPSHPCCPPHVSFALLEHLFVEYTAPRSMSAALQLRSETPQQRPLVGAEAYQVPDRSLTPPSICCLRFYEIYAVSHFHVLHHSHTLSTQLHARITITTACRHSTPSPPVSSRQRRIHNLNPIHLIANSNLT